MSDSSTDLAPRKVSFLIGMSSDDSDIDNGALSPDEFNPDGDDTSAIPKSDELDTARMRWVVVGVLVFAVCAFAIARTLSL